MSYDYAITMPAEHEPLPVMVSAGNAVPVTTEPRNYGEGDGSSSIVEGIVAAASIGALCVFILLTAKGSKPSE